MKRGFLILFVWGLLTSCNLLLTGTSEVVVENLSQYVISEVYITPSSSPDLGRNRLSSDERIRPDTERAFTVEPGVYDIYIRTPTVEGATFYFWEFLSKRIDGGGFRAICAD